VVGMRIYKGPVSRERNMVPANPICKNKAAGWQLEGTRPHSNNRHRKGDRKKSVEDLPL